MGQDADWDGIITGVFMHMGQSDRIDVAAGIAVQAEFSGGLEQTWGNINNSLGGSSGVGIAQASPAEVKTLNLGSLNPMDPFDSVKIMQARIDHVLEACKGRSCENSAKDKFIIAALAQNQSMSFLGLKDLLDDAKGGSINWNDFFSKPKDPSQIDAKVRQAITGMTYEKGFMLLKYIQDVRVLLAWGWKLPDGMKETDLDDLEKLAKGQG
jgi:hypothetical protein